MKKVKKGFVVCTLLPLLMGCKLILASCVCPKIPETPDGYYLCERCNKYVKTDGKKHYEAVWDHLRTHYFEDALKPKKGKPLEALPKFN